MIQTTKEYQKLIAIPGRKQFAKADITLASGEVLHIGSKEIAQGGIELSAATSQPNVFLPGAAVVSELNLTLINLEKQFESYDFTDAVIRPSVGLLTKQKWDGTQAIEWVPLGVFTVDEPVKTAGTVTLSALDNLSKFDRPYTESALKYPTTLGVIVADACTVCGVELATPQFFGSDYVVLKRPDDTAMTFREAVGYAAALGGNFARCNHNGALEIAWYDLSKQPANLAGIQTMDTAAADIMVTGVQITPSGTGKAYTSGTEGYVVKIENNPFAQENLQGLVGRLGNKLNGFTFRPYTIKGLSNPTIETGDTVLVSDKYGNTHTSFVSNLSYSFDGIETFTADAETKVQNQSKRFSKVDKAQKAAENAQQSADKANAGVEEAKTEITQLNGEIQLKVSKGSIIAEINISPENIKISAERLELTGLVTITNLENGTTTVNGACIRTGRVESENGDFWVDLESGEVYMNNGTFAGKIQWGISAGIWRNSSTLEIGNTNDIDISNLGGKILLNAMHGDVRLVSDTDDVQIRADNDITLECNNLLINGDRGITKDLLVFESEDNDRYLEITNGIITGWHDS